ncbi:MAG: hypothetical protein U7123_07225 [Potamolinea sp.]
MTDNELLAANIKIYIDKISADTTFHALHRLEVWLKYAESSPLNPPEGIDLEEARGNWEQVLIWFEDALLLALFKNDWGEVYDMIRQLKDCKDSKQEEDSTKHREAMQNLDAAFDLAFGE